MESIQERFTSALLRRIRRAKNTVPPSEKALPAKSGAVSPAKLREARFSDFPAVEALKRRWGLTADSLENWERLWHRNPAITETQATRPIGWILETDRSIVGYLGNISSTYRYGDETLSAVTAHGLVVDPAYRALSLTLVAAYFRQKAVDLFISTTAIEAVGKIALAFKAVPLPQADYDKVLFWVLRYRGFSQSLIKKLNIRPAMSSIAGAAVAVGVGADTLLRGRRPPTPSRSSDFEIKEISASAIGGDFQALWSEKLAESKAKPRLIAVRNPETLRWHFEDRGDEEAVRVLCCYRQNELLGYAVLCNEARRRRSTIADMLVRQDDPKVVGALWAAAYKRAKQAGSDTLEILGFPPNMRQVGAKWKPYSRRFPACPFFYKAADPALHNTLSDGAAWYACPFDGDASLIRPSSRTS